MIKKETIIKMLDEWIERLGDSDASEAIEVVLMMVKNRIENMPDELEDDMR